MEFKTYFRYYLYAWLVFAFFTALYQQFDIYFLVGLIIGFFMILPDLLDELLPEKYRRCALTHSVLMPIAWYWGLRPWLNLEVSAQFGLFLFYPMMIHLMIDFMDLWNEKENILTVKLFGLDFKRPGSLWFFMGNIGVIIGYMMWML